MILKMSPLPTMPKDGLNGKLITDMAQTLATVEQDGSDVYISVKEREVDTDELRALILDLKQRADESDAKRFIFCFKNVEFLPSACLALMLMFHQEVKQKHEGKIILANCQENVAFLLKLARLDQLFELAQGDVTEM